MVAAKKVIAGSKYAFKNLLSLTGFKSFLFFMGFKRLKLLEC